MSLGINDLMKDSFSSSSVGTKPPQLHFLLILFTPVPSPTHPSEREYTSTPISSPAPLTSLSEPPSIGLSVVVPAFNETDRLGVMLDETMEYLLSPPSPPSLSGFSAKAVEKARRVLGEGVEVIIVDDGSTDGTDGKARELAQSCDERAGGRVDVRVVRLVKNRGKGGAVQHVSEASLLGSDALRFDRWKVKRGIG
jgi:dolichyl-phosphate beta-glucosyltransferase